MRELPKPYQQFRSEYPSIYAAYEALGAEAASAGPLDAKTRELIKMGMAAANGSESGVVSHAHRALDAGASAAEIQHALIIGINTVGFSTIMAALGWAKKAVAGHRE